MKADDACLRTCGGCGGDAPAPTGKPVAAPAPDPTAADVPAPAPTAGPPTAASAFARHGYVTSRVSYLITCPTVLSRISTNTT